VEIYVFVELIINKQFVYLDDVQQQGIFLNMIFLELSFFDVWTFFSNASKGFCYCQRNSIITAFSGILF